MCLLSTCKRIPNILFDMVECLSCFHVGSKYRTCKTLCYLNNIDIFQYVTQKSACTRGNTLYFIIERNYANVYISIGSTCMYMYKGHLNRARPCSSVGCASDFKFNGYGFESHYVTLFFFHFVFCRFRHAPGRSTGPIQMKSSMTFIRCI